MQPEPSWLDPTWREARERQRSAISRELAKLGETRKAERMSLCCTRASRSALSCCGEKPRTSWNTCGVPNCPVCSPGRTREKVTAVWRAVKLARAQVLSELEEQGKKGRPRLLRMVTLTSRREPGEELTPSKLAAQARKVKSAARKLYRVMRGWQKPPRGLLGLLECGERGMVHMHCLVMGPYLDKPTLAHEWWKLTGWGSWNADRGRMEGHVGIDLAYHYDTPAKKRRARELAAAGDDRGARALRSYRENRRSVAELVKYLVKPSASPELAAAMVVGLGRLHRGLKLGVFARAKLTPSRSCPAEASHCPHCGSVAPKCHRCDCHHPARCSLPLHWADGTRHLATLEGVAFLKALGERGPPCCTDATAVLQSSPAKTPRGRSSRLTSAGGG